VLKGPPWPAGGAVRNGDRVLVASLEVAGTRAARARGVLGRPRLRAGHGLLLPGARQVHGFFLATPLRVAFVAADGVVVAVSDLRPWRLSRWVRESTAALELPTGAAVRVGDRLAAG